LEFPNHLRYTLSHEWALQEPNGEILVGISALAQDSLGELVYVELPAVGKTLAAGDACAVVESTKAASDVYAPVAGEVTAVNEALRDAPQTVNAAPYTDGWLFRIRPVAGTDLSALLSAQDYQAQAH
jgi:glycine cleavage system H protein